MRDVGRLSLSDENVIRQQVRCIRNYAFATVLKLETLQMQKRNKGDDRDIHAYVHIHTDILEKRESEKRRRFRKLGQVYGNAR